MQAPNSTRHDIERPQDQERERTAENTHIENCWCYWGGIAVGIRRFAADWLRLVGDVENQRLNPRDPFVQFVNLAIQGFNLRCQAIVKAADAGLNGGKLSEHQACEDKADCNDRYPILHGRIIPESGTGG